MRDIQITDQVGVLSQAFNHPKKLKVGMTQKLVFGDYDNFGKPEVGPFNWTAKDRADYKYDKIDGHKVVKMVKYELREVLKKRALTSRVGRKIL